MKLDFSYQAVIFDLDGVLANTEPAVFRIHQEVIAAYGPVLGSADYHSLFGLDYAEGAVFLIDKFAIPETPAHLTEILHDSVIEQITNDIESIPSSRELVESLAASGMKLGLASNSPCDYVKTIVMSLGLSSFFPAPVCRDEVNLGKPAPDPYLEACRRLAADPLHCLAIEDSPTGMRSALAAGMDCAVVGDWTPEDMPDRAFHFASITDLLTAVRSAIKA